MCFNKVRCMCKPCNPIHKQLMSNEISNMNNFVYKKDCIAHFDRH